MSLEVTDGRGLTGSAEMAFAAVPWTAMHVSLVWDQAKTDLDIHLVSEGEGASSSVEPFDCYFQNTDPDWGVAGESADDPWIDLDDVDGFGPENVNLNQ